MAAKEAQLEMIKYGFDYQLSNGLVMDGKINLELDVATPEKKIIMSFTPKSLPMVSTELRMTDSTVKAHVMSSYVTPNVPIIGNDKASCSMILDVDFATRILNILPTHLLSLHLNMNTVPVLKIDHSSKTPLLDARVDIPQVLTMPEKIHVNITNGVYVNADLTVCIPFLIR